MIPNLILILFISLLANTQAFASDDCLDSLKPKLPGLELNSNVIAREYEKRSYGTILLPKASFPTLQDGPYVFILDQNGHLAFSKRFPDLDPDAPVVTHRSLYTHLSETLGKTPTLVALGEIHVDHGVISQINNKAGTAFLPNEHLQSLAEILKARGLPITEETPIVPYDSVRPGHDSEFQAATHRIKMETTPRLRRLNRVLLEFRREVYKRFPKAGSPGMVDWMEFLSSPSGPINHYSLRTMTENQRHLLYCFTWLESPNDRYRVVQTLDQAMPENELDEIMSNLHLYEGVFL